MVVSAHSGARHLVVGSNPSPETVHDYFGFPAELYAINWPASGDPALSARVVALLTDAGLQSTEDPLLGLDHGIWVPLRAAWPEAEPSIVPVSVPVPSDPERLLAAGRALAPLREEGIALIGTGGLVHNLRQMKLGQPDAPPDSWAIDFERWVMDRVRDQGIDSLLRYRELAPAARLAVPTEEHFDPLFLVLGAMHPEDELTEIHSSIRFGNMALTTFALA